MAEAQVERVKDVLVKVIDDIDRSYLRKMQADMFSCAARCCQKTDDSKELVDNCVERCRLDLVNAEQLVQQQINSFQSRLQRCVSGCSEDYRDNMMSKPKESEAAKYSKQFESCVTTCVDNNLALVPKMVDRIKVALKQNAGDKQFV